MLVQIYVRTDLQCSSSARDGRGHDCHAPPQLTFLTDFDGAGGLYPLAIFIPLSRYVLHRELTNEHCVLILLDVQVVEALRDQQLSLCRDVKHSKIWRLRNTHIKKNKERH